MFLDCCDGDQRRQDVFTCVLMGPPPDRCKQPRSFFNFSRPLLCRTDHQNNVTWQSKTKNSTCPFYFSTQKALNLTRRMESFPDPSGLSHMSIWEGVKNVRKGSDLLFSTFKTGWIRLLRKVGNNVGLRVSVARGKTRFWWSWPRCSTHASAATVYKPAVASCFICHKQTLATPTATLLP